jgi:hypothetical protein
LTHKFICLISFLMLAAFLIPLGGVSAQEDKGAVTVPTLQAPRLTISLTNPTYKWSKITGATVYQLQVYQGSTIKIDSIVNSSHCASVCTITPSTTLSFSTFKWRVRAKVSGVWKAWTAYTYFTVSTAFNSQFNGNASGWVSRGGTWSIGSEYIYSTAVPKDAWSNYYRKLTTYANFDYSARVKQTANEYAGGLAVRMGLDLGLNNYLYPGYVFYYKNDGNYAIYRRDGDNIISVIVPYTPTTAIIPFEWNVLRVIAVGPTFHYYINGNLVASVTDASYASGYVGFVMLSDGPTDTFQVDWAKLTPLDASFLMTDTISPEQQALNDDAARSGIAFSESGE